MVRVDWGGFSMVNITMQIFQYVFGLLDVDEESDDVTVTKKKIRMVNRLNFTNLFIYLQLCKSISHDIFHFKL